MSYQIDITRIEITDQDGNVVIKVEHLDPCCAKVTMEVATDVHDWRELSNAVSEAIMLMKLEGDE